MFITIITFLIVAVIFFILSYFVQELWVYYVPSASLLVLIWIMTIIMRNKYVANNILKNYSELFSNEQADMLLNSPSIFLPKTELFTSFAQMEPNAACGYIMFISIGYSIFSIYLQNWSIFIISFIIIITIFYAINVSFPVGSDDDCIRAIIRYCRAKKN